MSSGGGALAPSGRNLVSIGYSTQLPCGALLPDTFVTKFCVPQKPVCQSTNDCCVCCKNLQELTEVMRKELGRRDSMIDQLHSSIREMEEQQEREIRLLHEQHKISDELAALGAGCKGEKHSQVIQRQKEALADARHKIKALELSKPPVPGAEQALTQVAILQRELTELRTQKSALSQMQVASSAQPQGEKFDLNEKCYLNCTKAIATLLNVDKLSGNRTMSHLSESEKEDLYGCREKDMRMLTEKLQEMLDQTESDKTVIETYESDLKNVKEMLRLSEERQDKASFLTAEVRALKDECEFVRESLKQSKDELLREKRLNYAIKTKKAGFLDQFDNPPKQWPRHRCEPPEFFIQEAKKEKRRK